MKTTSQLVSALMKTASTGCHSAQQSTRPAGNAQVFGELPRNEQGVIINHIFKELKRTFTGQFLKYEAAFNDPNTPDEWVKSQKRQLLRSDDFNRLTGQQIRKGVDKAIAGEFLPTMGRLIKLCIPSASDFGLPSPLIAWTEVCNHSHEVCSHKWTHDVVYLAGKKTGWHLIRTASGEAEVSRLQRAFIEHYQQQTNVVQSSGGGAEGAVAALEDHSQCSASEKAEQYGKVVADRVVSELGLPHKMAGAEALKRLKRAMVS